MTNRIVCGGGCGTHIVTKWASTWFERYDSLDNPAYAEWYRTIYSESVEKARSHSSVILYSVSNESDWGRNLTEGVQYIREADPTRPIMSSWGYMAPEGLTDIYSAHYADLPAITAKPTIWDEYTHLYSYQERLEKDPGLRTSYGEAIRNNFERILATEGVVGGCIWHSRDFAVLTPNGAWKTFSTTWGLLDIWNREKPEYYDVKKTYSPVKLMSSCNHGSGLRLRWRWKPV